MGHYAIVTRDNVTREVKPAREEVATLLIGWYFVGCLKI